MNIDGGEDEEKIIKEDEIAAEQSKYSTSYALVITTTEERNQSTLAEAVNFSENEEPDEIQLHDNPFIMVTNASVGPKSFVNITQNYDHSSPPPKYFDDDVLLQILPTRKNEIMKGLQEPAFGGLVCTDQEAMNR